MAHHLQAGLARLSSCAQYFKQYSVSNTVGGVDWLDQEFHSADVL